MHLSHLWWPRGGVGTDQQTHRLERVCNLVLETLQEDNITSSIWKEFRVRAQGDGSGSEAHKLLVGRKHFTMSSEGVWASCKPLLSIHKHPESY